MVEVTVDLSDLETLVFATGVIKNIEGVLNAYRRDPFVKQHLNYTPSVDRLVAAMNQAKRKTAETAIGWDDPLSETDLKTLKIFQNVGSREVSPEDNDEFWELCDSLTCRGYLEKGQAVAGAIWSSSSIPELRPQPTILVRITKRGLDAILENKS